MPETGASMLETGASMSGVVISPPAALPGPTEEPEAPMRLAFAT